MNERAPRGASIDLTPARERAVLVGLYSTQATVSPERLLDELESLVHAAGGEAIARVVQRRGNAREGGFGLTDRPVDPATWIGRGKVDEVAEAVRTGSADLVVFDNELSPAQIRELEKRVGCRVIDRSELILDIFASRARTRAARLQVELAQLRYTAPRLRGMWSHLERQGGTGSSTKGMGSRGPGEQQVEIDRRIVDKRIQLLQGELARIAERREREVVARTTRAWSVGLVGYTNAGKSTLFNALTGSAAFAADQLFATLDTTLRRWEVSPGVAIPLADTVGFVRDLPHHLVESFRSTLSETLYAELLLHVVDASHPEALDRIRAVSAVLDELGVAPERVLAVLNKVDAVTDPDVLMDLRAALPGARIVSALTGDGLDALTAEVARRRSDAWAELRLVVPHADARVSAWIHEHGEVRGEHWDDEGWTAQVAVPRSLLPRIQQWVVHL